jgi:arabinosyltransferase
MYCSGLFYMRPTQASLDVLHMVFDRIKKEHGWDQALFNEVIFFPSRPGYTSPCPTLRIMDRFLFMNSKTLFVYLRKDKAKYEAVKPVMVHVNYHSDKWPRFLAVAKRYVDGKKDALDSFSDAST